MSCPGGCLNGGGQMSSLNELKPKELVIKLKEFL